jgi:hypothetical protein
MTRTPSGWRLRVSIPFNNNVTRRIDSLNDNAARNAEVVRLAELGANLEELWGPVRSITDMAKLLYHSASPALLPVQVAAAPVAATAPVPMVKVPTSTASSAEEYRPGLPPRQLAEPLATQPAAYVVASDDLAAHMWLPD